MGSNLSPKEEILSTASFAKATGTCLLMRSSCPFKRTFSIVRQLSICQTVLRCFKTKSESFECTCGTKDASYITISTLPIPIEIWATGGGFKKKRGRRDSTWPSGVQGSPSLHMAVCDEWPRVKELWIIDLIKLQMLKIRCLWREKWLVFKQNHQKILHQHFQAQRYYYPQPQPPPKFKQKTSDSSTWACVLGSLLKEINFIQHIRKF